MMIKCITNIFCSHGSMLFLLLLPFVVIAKTCPDSSMPQSINALYVKYKITDELEINSYKSLGAPSDVQGDELAELIIWKGYRWERLFGKYWFISDEDTEKDMDAFEKKMEVLLKKQMQGQDVDQEVAKLAEEVARHQPENKTYEYDRIDVHTPKYELNYNRSTEVGYGYYGVTIDSSTRKKLGSRITSKLDPFIASNFRNSKNIFGIKKETTSSSSFLGIPCRKEVLDTSFQDFEREYGKIENCVANISGHDVDLYTKMGMPGKKYIMQAIEIKESYKVNKNLFCAPSYVEVDK